MCGAFAPNAPSWIHLCSSTDKVIITCVLCVGIVQEFGVTKRKILQLSVKEVKEIEYF